MKSIEGKNVLITGASSGIGYLMAKIIAQKGANIVLVARRKENLDRLKEEITKSFKVKVEIIAMDLSVRGNSVQLYNEVQKMGIRIDILINNAGYGNHNYFIDIPWEKEMAMLDLLIFNLTHLTKLFAGDMIKNRYGRILNVSSVGAFQPTPTYATYSAAKSYVLNFGVALNRELKHSGVKCSTLCPGVTSTEFTKVAEHETDTFFMKLTRMSAPRVAKIGIKKMIKGKPIIIPGVINSINAFLTRFLPRTLVAAIAEAAMGKPKK